MEQSFSGCTWALVHWLEQWSFSQILIAVEPYGEREKVYSTGKTWKKFRPLHVELLIADGHAAIRISKFLKFFELWNFLDFFKEFLVKFHKKCLYLRKFQIFSKTLDFAGNIPKITAKYESNWPMGNWLSSSFKRWHIWQRFCLPKSEILL